MSLKGIFFKSWHLCGFRQMTGIFAVFVIFSLSMFPQIFLAPPLSPVVVWVGSGGNHSQNDKNFMAVFTSWDTERYE